MEDQTEHIPDCQTEPQIEFKKFTIESVNNSELKELDAHLEQNKCTKADNQRVTKIKSKCVPR